MSIRDLVSIPLARNAPKPESKPAYKPEIPNFADNEETVSKSLDWMNRFINHFENQSAWKVTQDVRDQADEMYRAAATRSSLSAAEGANEEDTRSNVPSPTYNSTIRIITAGEKTIILGEDEDLPMHYEPPSDAPDFIEDEGKRMGEDQDIVLSDTMDKTKMRDKIGRILLFANKYADRMIEMIWDYRKEERFERVPVFAKQTPEDAETERLTGKPVPRTPKSFRFEKKERTIADNPDLIERDLKDCRFDAMIPDMQDQSCISFIKDVQLSDIYALQRVNEYKNVGKITKNSLSVGEADQSTNELQERQENAGETGDSMNPTGLYRTYRTWIRLPLDEKGKWDEEKILPHWHLTVWVGDRLNKPVCVKISPNPNCCKQVPTTVVHSHDDDKGALNLGYAVLLKAAYVMGVTVLDQAFDNVTARNQKPLIADRGSISGKKLTVIAGGNRVIWKTPGSKDPQEMDIQETTQTTVPMYRLIEEIQEKAAGTNKPFLGQPLGGRASAQEAKQVFTQATRPALEDAKYKAKQILPFIGFWVMEMTRQFGDPKRRILFTQNNEIREVKPAELWGPLKIRVTSVKHFQDDALRRAEDEVFLNQIFPLAKPVMGEDLQIRIFKQMLKNRGFSDVENGWKIASKAEVIRVVDSENQNILMFGMEDNAAPGEDHEEHLKGHKSFLGDYVAQLPKEEQSEENIRLMKLHISQHEQLLERAQAEEAIPQAAAPRAETGLGSEAVGDEMAAKAGAMENLGAPVG